MKRPFFNTAPVKKIVADDFIKRIRSLVIGEGMLTEGNISLMDHAIQHLPVEGHVLEIGSYGGLSTNLIIYLLDKYKKTNLLFTCDAWIYEGYHDHEKNSTDNHIDGRPDILRDDYSTYIKAAFINAAQFLSPHRLPYSFHARSEAFFKEWKNNQTGTDIFGREIKLGGPISFAYIDGGHSYEVAWHDFTNVTEYLVKDGFILLDDSADGSKFGSAKMMHAIKKDKRFKVVDKNPNYLIQKIS